VTRHRFFTHSLIVSGEEGALDESQARQVRTVLRLKTGDPITVFDGSGLEAQATLTVLAKDRAEYRIEHVARPDREPDLHLTVGLALLRGDRFEYAAQKLTELGVRRIVPLSAERCVVSFRDARDWDKRAARYQRIIVEAMEQSERVTTVELGSPVRLDAFLGQHCTIVLRERAHGPSVASMPLSPEMAIAIGPEGGWSDAELEIIEDRALAASLGGLILRADTAAIVAAGTLIQRSYDI
jgi:16S rRNA (uracil1498-N3)-methyltransferase